MDEPAVVSDDGTPATGAFGGPVAVSAEPGVASGTPA
jgi:hypothetical protein